MTIVKIHIHILHLFLCHDMYFCHNIQVYLCKNAIWRSLYFFISRTGWSISCKFCEIKRKTTFNLIKEFDWSGKKYLFTVMENEVQFSHRIGNSVFNRLFNFFSMIILSNSGWSIIFKLCTCTQIASNNK